MKGGSNDLCGAGRKDVSPWHELHGGCVACVCEHTPRMLFVMQVLESGYWSLIFYDPW